MALADILGSLGNLLPALAGQNGVPGFAGGTFPVGGIGEGGALPGPDLNQALSRNAQLGQQRQQRPPGTPGKFMNTLGMIGDALAMWRGGQPMYQMQLKQRQAEARQQGINDALRNYLTDPEAAIQAVMQIDPMTGIELHQGSRGKTPEEIALMRMVGIDPTSEEGKAIIKSRLMGRQGSSFARELQDFGFTPEEAKGIARRRYTRPIIIGNAETGFGILEDEGETGGEVPTVNSQEEYDALPPGAQYRDSQGNIGVKRGGPTPSASGGFR